MSERQLSRPKAFDNGLTFEQDDEIDEVFIEIGRLAKRIEVLGKHRSLALAVTNLDQARHWLQDRKHRAP